MSSFATALAGVTGDQVTLLVNAGVLIDIDLGTLSQSDFDTLVPDASIVTRRRLFSIGQYVTTGEVLDAETTMLHILTKLKNITSPTSVAAPPAAFFPDPSRGAPKMYVDGLTDFGGGHLSSGKTGPLGPVLLSDKLSTLIC